MEYFGIRHNKKKKKISTSIEKKNYWIYKI